MKNLSSRLIKLPQKSLMVAWIGYHAAVLLFFLLSFAIFHNNFGIDSDLFNMVPKSLAMDSVRKADEKMMGVTAQNLFVLIKNEDFAKAKADATEVYEAIKDSDNFTSVALNNDIGSMSEITDYLYKYRYNLLDEKTADALLGGGKGESDGLGGMANGAPDSVVAGSGHDSVVAGGGTDGVAAGSGHDGVGSGGSATSSAENYAKLFATNALAQAYSGFNMLPLDNLDTDPFMLTEKALSSYLASVQKAGTAMTVKDGVLASQYEGQWVVMLRCLLSKKGGALATKNNGVSEIYRACQPLEKDGTTFVYSGTAFHSHESSLSASREISLIATISMLVVIIMLLLVFRSPKPIFASVGSILISILVAILSTLAVFHKMHMIALVFGTSLIGSCIDYSLHYFVHWAGNPSLKSGQEIRNHIFSGLIMAILSTGICFAILLFAPFSILRQMSVFCLSGLISSFLTTIAIYPYLKLPVQRKIRYTTKFSKIIQKVENKYVGRAVITFFFAFSIISIAICHKNVSIKNNVLGLYDMKGQLLQDEIEAGKITHYAPAGWFIVSGDTEQEALENEEALRRDFVELTGGSVGFVSTSAFVPSIESQKKSREAAARLMPLAQNQFENLGFDDGEMAGDGASGFGDTGASGESGGDGNLDDGARLSQALAADLQADFAATSDDFISFEKGNVPAFITNAISSAWLGKVGGKYYTVFLPTSIPNFDAVKALAAESENRYFISKSNDISQDLDRLTNMVLKFFMIAYVLMFIMLSFFYKPKQAFKIISVPILIILVVTAIFAICKINLEFFSVTGLILVFGLGLDYIIYMMENEKKEAGLGQTLEPFATALSFLTTVISFGALALSSFKPVHLIGLAIFIGLTTAYVSSFFYGRLKK